MSSRCVYLTPAFQVSSSIWAQLSTPLSITYSLAASEQHSRVWSLLPANSGTPSITHKGHLSSGTSSWRNVTLWSWLKRQAPTSPVSCPSAAPTSTQRTIQDRQHKRNSLSSLPPQLWKGQPITYALLYDNGGREMSLRTYISISRCVCFKQMWKSLLKPGSKTHNLLTGWSPFTSWWREHD